jgi:hypothetical protein
MEEGKKEETKKKKGRRVSGGKEWRRRGKQSEGRGEREGKRKEKNDMMR